MIKNLKPIGDVQDFSIVSDKIAGRFNGTVAGIMPLQMENKVKIKPHLNCLRIGI